MNAVPAFAILSAADAAFPTRQVLRNGHNEMFAVSRSRDLQTVLLAAGSVATRITIELTPTLALELSTLLRRQAETLQREIAVRAAVEGSTP